MNPNMKSGDLGRNGNGGMNRGGRGEADIGDGIGFLGRGASMNEIDLSGGNDMLLNPRGRGGGLGEEDQLKNVNDPFALLMSPPVLAKDASSESGDGSTPRKRKRKGGKNSRKHQNQSEDEDS